MTVKGKNLLTISTHEDLFSYFVYKRYYILVKEMHSCIL